MRVVVQRALNATCSVDGKEVSKINKGFMLLVGFTNGDTINEVKKLAYKTQGLRVFEDENGKMNKSLNDIGGEILSISQFTLYADSRKGFRPSFTDALNPAEAIKLYDEFNRILREEYNLRVACGIFGADMKISFTNDGPVTIILDSNEIK